jgi:hypothetical protein
MSKTLKRNILFLKFVGKNAVFDLIETCLQLYGRFLLILDNTKLKAVNFIV